MSLSSTRFPPPNALLAFEASARNESFTEAAKELKVTRVAISRQVKQLENSLGFELFTRGQRSVQLTTAGRRLSRVSSTAFQSIIDEIDALKSSNDDRLITFATTSGISTYWLMPRIGRYREIDPDADFRLLTSYDLINLVESNVDIAIRYGDGIWPGVNATLLQRQLIFPACTQAFVNKYGPFNNLKALSKVSLLNYETAADPSSSWPNYFRDMGEVLGDSPRMSSYASFINFVQAVLDGQGVGLLGSPLMQQFLDSGVIVPAIDIAPLPQRGYYLCKPDGITPSSTVDQFCNWLLDELSDKSK